MVETITKEKIEIEVENTNVYDLILHNDEHHSFEEVIRAIELILKWTLTQAEQVTIIAHHNGKCPLISGDKEKLMPVKMAFGKKGITTTID